MKYHWKRMLDQMPAEPKTLRDRFRRLAFMVGLLGPTFEEKIDKKLAIDLQWNTQEMFRQATLLHTEMREIAKGEK